MDSSNVKTFYCCKTDLFMISHQNNHGIVPIHHLADYYPLQGYLVGEAKNISVSLRNYVVENGSD